MPISDYFPLKQHKHDGKTIPRNRNIPPESKYSATIKVEGSGKPSQMDAIILGLSRALAKVDEEFDKTLRKQGFMTRDSRMVERKKPFFRKAKETTILKEITINYCQRYPRQLKLPILYLL